MILDFSALTQTEVVLKARFKYQYFSIISSLIVSMAFFYDSDCQNYYCQEIIDSSPGNVSLEDCQGKQSFWIFCVLLIDLV